MDYAHLGYLGLLERYHVARQSLRLDSCVVVAAKFSNASNERLSEDAVFFAVAHAVQTHAALSARVIDEKGPNPRFDRLSEVRLEQVIHFLDKDDNRAFAKVIEEEFTNPIDASKDLPLWRITVASDNHVIFSWHHAIGDGQSGLAVLRTIIEGLNRDSYDSFN